MKKRIKQNDAFTNEEIEKLESQIEMREGVGCRRRERD